MTDLEDRQKKRRRRTTLDQLDRAITDLVSFYRDVLVLQLDAGVGLVNDDVHAAVAQVAAESRSEQTLRRVDGLERTRGLLEANLSPLLAFESLMVALKDPSLLLPAR